MTPSIVKAFRIMGDNSGRFGSPFQGALAHHIADAAESGDSVEGLFEPWRDHDVRQLMAGQMALLMLCALNDIALSGDAPALAAAFPTPDHPGDPAEVWRLGRALIAERRDAVAAFMGHEPQTNEVNRAACLLPGFLTVAGETGLPLRTFELGASAGLNLSWDRFHYDLSGATWGDPASRVRIAADWQGTPPLTTIQAKVLSRAACDRRPVRLSDPDQRRRLLSYIWPGQFHRFARIQAAITLALEEGVEVQTADAAEWTEQVAAPQPGAATVVYHSVFWQYLPPETQGRLRRALEAHGAAASQEAPFAWLRMEPTADDVSEMSLRLTLWPGGEERLLARVHPHGEWVKWAA